MPANRLTDQTHRLKGKKRILSVHYSQTGQLTRILDSILSPICDEAAIEVDYLVLEPTKPFPFPWPFWKFFSIFPECIFLDPDGIKPIGLAARQDYDLVILAYQVWFLSPSLPMTAFLKTDWARQVLHNTPVVTVIGCRNMWLNAQEVVKSILESHGARLIDNVVLTDEVGSAASFISTPLWLLTGKKQAYSWVPPAGVAEKKIRQAERFGKAIASRLIDADDVIANPMLKGLGAVTIEENIIASEKIGDRSFKIWGRLMRLLGPPDSRRRKIGLFVYIGFLILAILTIVPLNALINKWLYPIRKEKLIREKLYFSQPSGE